MSDEMMNHGQIDRESEFEQEDLGTRGVYAFMLGLTVIGVVIYFIIAGMYTFLDHYERSQMATSSPLITTKGAISRVVTKDDMEKTFRDNGAPLLETDERSQLRDFLVKQEDQLNSYGWVDEKAGVAHIPITRAMELMVERGVPVYQSGNKEATAAPGKASAQKSAAPKQ
jgi:hypothetical protein